MTKVTFETGKFLMNKKGVLNYGVVPILYITEGIHVGFDFSRRVVAPNICAGQKTKCINLGLHLGQALSTSFGIAHGADTGTQTVLKEIFHIIMILLKLILF